MGGFLYYNKQQSPPDAARLRHSLQALEKKQLSDGRSLPLNEIIETDDFAIHFYNKIGVQSENLLRFPDGDFILFTGTLIYKKQTGVNALKELYTDFIPDKFKFDALRGHFCVLIYKNKTLYTWNDYFGVYHVFTNKNHGIISSSFLSVVRLLDKKQLHLQAMYEYAREGACYGDDTYIQEVKLLNAFKIHQPGHRHQEIKKTITLPVISSTNFNDRVAKTVEHLLDYFDAIKQSFGNEVCSALSGGYDSRLILALLTECDIEPSLYVYGSEQSADVQIAKSISAGEGLTIHHDNRIIGKPSLENFHSLMQLEYFYCDGHGPNGAFTNGAEQAARTIRTDAAGLQLNGGGGEIFRNFWKLPDKPIRINQFLKSRFDSLPSNYFQDNFNSDEYLKNMSNKIQFMLEIDRTLLTREELEKLYVYMRIKYWMGYNTSIQNVRSYALIPFAEPIFAISSFIIPFKQKECGIFEAALINQINPKLASYNSAYGHNFSDKPTVKTRIKNSMAVNIPIAMRRTLRQYRYRLLRSQLPIYLHQDYINSVVPKDGLYMQEYFNLENIRDPLMLSRLHTINLVLSDPF